MSITDAAKRLAEQYYLPKLLKDAAGSRNIHGRTTEEEVEQHIKNSLRLLPDIALVAYILRMEVNDVVATIEDLIRVYATNREIQAPLRLGDFVDELVMIVGGSTRTTQRLNELMQGWEVSLEDIQEIIIRNIREKHGEPVNSRIE
jgi:hypothetical protein